MARLINADRALEIVRNQGIAHPNAYYLTNYTTLILQEAPTIDAVPVVRCKDCKYGEVDDADLPTQYLCNYHGADWNDENHFCSYGERKGGDIIGAPAADVAPVRHGKWECQKPCPVCGEDRFKGLDADIWSDWEPPYCPNCGAKMDEEVSE